MLGRAASCACIAAIGLAVACGGAPPPAVPVDDWSRTPLTPEWSFLARGVAGDRQKECAAVEQALGRERTCVASLCAEAVPLGKEWLLRCRAVAPASVAAVEQLAQTFEERVREAPTECGLRASSILRDQCSEPKACRPLVERWAASCAGSEGTPLVMRKLERAVALAEGIEGYSLDTRSCGELFGDVVRAARCESKRQCEEALGVVEAFRTRCMVAGEPLSWSTALSLVSVLSGAGRRVSPVLLASTEAERGPEGPLSLVGGRGALLRLCGEPVTSGKQVAEARRDCRDGEVLIARAFPSPQGPTLRVGGLAFADDATFDARFPSLHVVAEEDAAVEGALPGIVHRLDQAVGHAKAGAPLEAYRALIGVLVGHVELLEHPRLAAELSRRDEALAPALRELGRAKVAAARRAKSADLPAFAHRASARVLADVLPDGQVEIGQMRAARGELGGSMPRAVAAYRDALAELAGILRVRAPKPLDGGEIAAAARTQIQRCAAAAKAAQAREEAALACAFELEPCEAEDEIGRLRELDRARLERRRLVELVDAMVASAPPDVAGALSGEQRAASCLPD